MTDELHAACERLRRYQAASDAGDVAAMDAVYNAVTVHCDNIWSDQADVANAYLAEHPADDDEPITDDWLAANRFQDRGELMGYSILLPPANAGAAIAELFVSFCPDGAASVAICQGVPDDPNVKDDHVVLTSLPDVLTRGQLRRLCLALGIDLKENANATT